MDEKHSSDLQPMLRSELKRKRNRHGTISSSRPSTEAPFTFSSPELTPEPSPSFSRPESTSGPTDNNNKSLTLTSTTSTTLTTSTTTTQTGLATVVEMAVPATLPAIDPASISLRITANATTASTTTNPILLAESLEAGQLSPSTTLSWSFLAHPILPRLPKWPALARTPNVKSMAAQKLELLKAQQQPPLLRDSKGNLPLLRLLDVPPIAASIASNLYGHDLRTLRQLNSSFRTLLSTTQCEDAKRPYYHVLLLKTLLCPRKDLKTEPVGVSCVNGGNTGPCVFCLAVVCSTCVSPEIWTTRRYRYLCPRCISTETPACKCQTNLWICRTCYKSRWLTDINYSAGGWFRGSITNCNMCATTMSHKTDKRIPALAQRSLEFRSWMTLTKTPSTKTTTLMSRGAKAPRAMPSVPAAVVPPPDAPGGDGAGAGVATVAGEALPAKRRPVACGWCQQRIDANKEDWDLRPETIRRGEERGKLWMSELERRRRERDGSV